MSQKVSLGAPTIMKGVMMEKNLENLIPKAREGDKEALEGLIRGVQDGVYNLAVRILWHPEDAEDATQEILIRVIVHLNSFRGDSSFFTWVYRIASNHLLRTKKCRAEQRGRLSPQIVTG